MSPLHRTARLAAPLALLLFAAPALAEPVELRLNLQQGDTYLVDYQLDQRIEQTVQGIHQQIEQSVGIGYQYDVLHAEPDGDQRLRVTFRTLRVRMGGPTAVDYDSQREAGQPMPMMARAFAAVVGQSFEVTLTPRNRVRELSGAEEMIDNILAELGDALGPMRGMIEDRMRIQFGEEALRGQIDTTGAIYPERPVSVGDQWEHQMQAAGGSPAIIHTTYTLRTREDGVATVAMTSRITPPDDPEPIRIGDIRMTMAMEGQSSGLIRIDEATGWQREATIDEDTTGETLLLEAPGLPQPMAVPTTMTGTVRMTTRQ